MSIDPYQFITTVAVAPQITPFDFGEDSINSGDSTSLHCSIHKGDLPINISWLHNNKSIGYMEGILISKAGKKASTISIDSVQEQHSGIYTCIAENKAGAARNDARLNVNGILLEYFGFVVVLPHYIPHYHIFPNL